MSPGRISPLRWRARNVWIVLAAVLALNYSAPISEAQPGRIARIEGVQPITDRLLRVFVDSPAMGEVQVLVLVPAQQQVRGRRHPTVYLLDGRSAAPGENNWLRLGNAGAFFADKPVNVVLTAGGTAGYYTDWQRPDPTLGNYKWETFLTKELPPLIDAEFDGNGRNAIGGLSMGAEAAMMLAFRAPQVYRAAAGFSGCYTSADEVGQAQMRAVVASFGGQADNMFGPVGNPDWAAHDVLSHAEALRGKALYLSAGNGKPGRYETLRNPDLVNAVIAGGVLELGAGLCTHQFADRLAALHIPATVNFRPEGVHSWSYWTDELASAWPVLAKGLGL